MEVDNQTQIESPEPNIVSEERDILEDAKNKR
jgi:hypothetical protein